MQKFVVILLLCMTILTATLVTIKTMDRSSTSPIKPPVQSETKPKPEAKPEITFDELVQSITAEEIKADVSYLASDELEGRMSGKQGNVKAADHIKKKLESFGLPTMYDKFSVRRMNPGPKKEYGDDFTQNIYGWIDGKDIKDEVIVIGAHMDHVGYGPQMSRSPLQLAVHNGADDNASGTAAVLEIAEAFSLVKDKVKRTIVFQLYSGEELGLIGSKHYCETPKFPQTNPSMGSHIAMINLDMIGHLGNQASNDFDFLEWKIPGTDLENHISYVNKKYSLGSVIRYNRGAGGGSDHVPFYNKGVPVVFFNTGLTETYHRPTDDTETLNYQGCEKIAQCVFELAWKISQYGSKMNVDYGNIKSLDSFHDHDSLEIPFQP